MYIVLPTPRSCYPPHPRPISGCTSITERLNSLSGDSAPEAPIRLSPASTPLLGTVYRSLLLRRSGGIGGDLGPPQKGRVARGFWVESPCNGGQNGRSKNLPSGVDLRTPRPYDRLRRLDSPLGSGSTGGLGFPPPPRGWNGEASLQPSGTVP